MSLNAALHTWDANETARQESQTHSHGYTLTQRGYLAYSPAVNRPRNITNQADLKICVHNLNPRYPTYSRESCLNAWDKAGIFFWVPLQ